MAGAILAAIGFVIFSAIVRDVAPAGQQAAAPRLPEQGGKKQSDFLLGVKNLRVWFIGLYFATLLVSSVGILSFCTEYFSDAYGMARTSASALASLGYWFTVVGGAAAGIVSRLRRGNSLKSQFIQAIVCGVASMAVYPFGFLVSRSWAVPYLFACGLVYGYASGVAFGTVPRLAHHPRLTGITMGIIFVCQNISSFCASP